MIAGLIESALQGLAALVSDSHAGADACRQIVEIASTDPCLPGVPMALDAIPPEARGEAWRQVYGEAQIALGNYRTAESHFAHDGSVILELQFNQLRALAMAGNAEGALFGLTLCALDRLPAKAVVGLASNAVSAASGCKRSAARVVSILSRLQTALDQMFA